MKNGETYYIIIQWGKQDKFYLLVSFCQKIWKVLIINNYEEHTRKIEDRVSSWQLFSFSRKADSKIALHASKSRANAEVLSKDTHLDASYLYSFHVGDMKITCVKTDITKTITLI